MKSAVEELKRRGRIGASWLAGQVAPDGTIPAAGDDLGCYYKCVLPLRLAGYPAEAARVLDKIMQLHYTADGDLRNSAERKTSGTYTSVFCQVYPNGWITLGAHSLGRFDVVRLLMDGIMKPWFQSAVGIPIIRLELSPKWTEPPDTSDRAWPRGISHDSARPQLHRAGQTPRQDYRARPIHTPRTCGSSNWR